MLLSFNLMFVLINGAFGIAKSTVAFATRVSTESRTASAVATDLATRIGRTAC